MRLFPFAGKVQHQFSSQHWYAISCFKELEHWHGLSYGTTRFTHDSCIHFRAFILLFARPSSFNSQFQFSHVANVGHWVLLRGHPVYTDRWLREASPLNSQCMFTGENVQKVYISVVSRKQHSSPRVGYSVAQGRFSAQRERDEWETPLLGIRLSSYVSFAWGSRAKLCGCYSVRSSCSLISTD